MKFPVKPLMMVRLFLIYFVQLVSFSLFVYVVPEKPSHADVETKIILPSDDRNLTLTQYPITIDKSLFSDENGDLTKYLVYARQGEESFLFDTKIF
jgi:hypothetical protein